MLMMEAWDRDDWIIGTNFLYNRYTIIKPDSVGFAYKQYHDK